MLNNISWGTKIAAVYIGFVVLILSMVALSMKQNIELVSEDYYAKELNFQNTIDDANNAKALPEQIKHEILNSMFKITFPEIFKNKTIKGTVEFYRPSDKTKDFTTAIALNEQMEQAVELKHFSKGMYKMKTTWNDGNTNYFTEEIIVIP